MTGKLPSFFKETIGAMLNNYVWLYICTIWASALDFGTKLKLARALVACIHEVRM